MMELVAFISQTLHIVGTVDIFGFQWKLPELFTAAFGKKS
jgi:hypothetical protein